MNAQERRVCDEVIRLLHDRVDDHDEKIAQMLATQKTMTESIAQLNTNMGRVADALEAWTNLRGFWITLKFISTVLKICVPIAVFFGALWMFLRTGEWLTGK